MKIPLVGSSYNGRSLNAAGMLTMNLLMDVIEQEAGKSRTILFDRPGLEQAYDLGPSGIRGSITVNKRTFQIAGTKLFELLASGSANFIANVISDGTPVSMAGGVSKVFFASAGQPYVLDLSVSPPTLSTIPADQLGATVLMVGYCAGFFLALMSNGQIFASDVEDPTTWDGASTTRVNTFSDNATSIFSDHLEMWVFGPKAIQVFSLTGGSPFPFDANLSGFIEHGLAAPFAIAKADNSIFWLEGDDRGNGIVRRANGYNPARVSDHALEYELSQYPTIGDCIACSFQFAGHEIVQFNFPTADKTKWYDTSTGQWLDMGFWNTQAGRFTRFRGEYHTFNFGKHLVGDPTTGAVYRMAEGVYKDFGNPKRCERIGPHLCNEQKRIFINKVQIDLEPGVGPVPPLSGNQLPTIITLADPSGGLWNLSITDTGVLSTDVGGSQAKTLYINDPNTSTSWQITVDQLGAIVPSPVTFNASYPSNVQFVSQSGTAIWSVSVQRLNATIAVISADLFGPVTRGPLIMLQWSRDGGHTFPSEQQRDFGQAGEYKKRVIFNRQGSGRDLVPKIVITDPVPVRIIDAYLEAS